MRELSELFANGFCELSPCRAEKAQSWIAFSLPLWMLTLEDCPV